MADNIRATPRNELLGLLSDAMSGGLNWMRDPQRTQQMQGLAGLLESTGIPKTTERMAYGEDLTNINRANVPLLKPETADALMNVAPLAPVAGRVASRTVRATEGLPVGMSIKDVSPKIGINVNQGGSGFADKIISGEKKFETRESDSLRAYVGKRVGIIRTGEGKAKAIGDVTLGEPIVISSPEEFAKLRDLHLVPEGSKFDIKKGGAKYLYPIENPVPYGVEKDVAKYGIVSRKILGEPDTLEKALYPQQAALDLAQQRAALPVEQGGLGLPANNTAADRAKAMGFDVDAYHGTTTNFQSPNQDVFASQAPSIANRYAFKTDENGSLVMPLMIRSQVPTFEHLGANAYRLTPEEARSRFAAFDPFRKDVATATAMGVALPDLLAAELPEEELKRNQSAGLLFP